jgi:hypothetical protein
VAISSEVTVALKAVGQAAFKGAMQEAAGAIGGVDKAADKAEDSTGRMANTMGKSGGKLKSTVGTLAKWAGASAAIGAGAHYLHGAVDATEGLAKSTMTLQRATGLDAEQASAWAEVTKVRGINTKQFQVGLVKMSKTMSAANSGNKKAAATLAAVGVSADTIHAGDVTKAISQSADVFSAMVNPAEKAAKAQELFGKQGQALLPMLSGGSAGLQEQLDMAKQYGAVIGTDGVEHTKEMAAQQREMKMASDGLKISLGEALVPAMVAVSTELTKIVTVMQPVLRNATAMKVIITLLTTAFLVYRGAMMVSTLMTLAFNAALLLIPLAIAAIVIGLVLAYKKVGWFRDAVNAAFGAVKAAAVAVFNWIKNAAVNTFNWIRTAASNAINWISGAWGKIKDGARAAIDGVKGAFRGVVGWFRGVGSSIVNGIVNGIKSAPGAIYNAIGSLLSALPLPGFVKNKLRGALGFHATGGVVRTPYQIVGERGPELAALPRGTRITPLRSSVLAPPTLAGAAAGLGAGQTTAHFYLDRRLVATAVAQDTADQQARR